MHHPKRVADLIRPDAPASAARTALGMDRGYVGLVATKGNDLQAGRIQDTTGTGRTYLARVYLPYGASNLVLSYANYQGSGSNYELANGNDIIVKASVWTSSAGTVRYPVTFAGAPTVTIPGTLAYGVEVHSDPVGLYLPAGSYAWIATYVKASAAGGYFPIGDYIHPVLGSTGEGYGAVGADFTDAGTPTTTTVDNQCYSPTAIRGSAPAGVSVGLLGDSIFRGTGDTWADLGFGTRALGATLSVGANYPYVRLAHGGERTDHQQGVLRQLRLRRAVACTHLLVNTGTNDLPVGGMTLATLQANLLEIWAAFGVAGTKIFQCTIAPRSNSTDGYRTAANQSIPSAGQETIRAGLNGWLRGGAPISSGIAVAAGTFGALRSGRAGHPLAGWFDVCAPIEVDAAGVLATNGGRWKPPGTVYDSGTSSGSNGSSMFNDTSKAWATNVHAGRRISITGGTGANQSLTVQANTATAMVISGVWSPIPDATSTYQVDDGCAWSATGTVSDLHPSSPGHVLMAAQVDTTRFIA